MKFPRVFRARMSQAMYDRIKEISIEMGGARSGWSQQECFRRGVEMFIEAYDKSQGVTPTLTTSIITSTVEVAKHDPTGRRHQKGREPMKKPEPDPAKRKGKTMEDNALTKLRKHVDKVERSRG